MHKIVITDPVGLRAAIEFAQNQGCLEQFGVDLCRLLQVMTGGMVAKIHESGTCEPTDTPQLAEIGQDFAPYSFSFAIWRGERERSNLVLNGGWIYSGPGAPSDGSFPSLTVSLSDVTGQPRPKHTWRCHT